MIYRWSFSKLFATEFANFSTADQDKIIDFTDIYEVNGLSDFSLYEGKIASSWSGANMAQSDHDYALNNSLWHYHVGIPHFTAVHPKYNTSEWLLHFQKISNTNIKIVDLYSHYTSSGGFYLPPNSYLLT